jgi:hypothetical protein
VQFDEVWTHLETDVTYKGASGILKRRVLPESPCDIYLAVEKPQNTRLMLIRVSAGALPDVGVLPRSKGCDVQVVRLPDDLPEQATVRLTLTGTQFRDIFTVLVQDIASCIAECVSAEHCVSALIARLQSWQHFLDEYGPEGLGEEAQRGLYGELWFLRRYVLPALTPADAVNSWTGHRRYPQDFELPRCAVEVKTTSGRQHQKLRIANERQLDDSNISPIFIFHISLDVRLNSGETLVDLVEDIRSYISTSPPARQGFEEGLRNGGYLDFHTPRYTKTGYSIRQTNVFRVSEGFPRIIESDLPNGVGDVQYSITVAECMHFFVPEGEMTEFIARI